MSMYKWGLQVGICVVDIMTLYKVLSFDKIFFRRQIQVCRGQIWVL